MYGFEELDLYQRARQYRKKISSLTKTFPQDERFRLTDQMIRASRSVTNQIAEGHGRYHFQENIQFCRIARGSLDELHDHLNIAHDEKFIEHEKHQELIQEKHKIAQLLNGYIKFLQRTKREF